MNQELIEHASRLICYSKHVVGLTGAGLSTPSGIPDFRSNRNGLWETDNPQLVASLTGFRYNPLGFYKWIHPLVKNMLAATPNPAHYALARLEQLNYLQGLITQNIDLLHTKAGLKTIFEVHGHVRQMTCVNCFKEYDAEPFLKKFLETREITIPRCPSCQGVLKPDVILFGEQLPAATVRAARKALNQADLMIVAGTSLEVMPVADYPRQVKMRGGKVIIINREPTHFDGEADIIFREDVVDVLPAIAEAVEAITKAELG